MSNNLFSMLLSLLPLSPAVRWDLVGMFNGAVMVHSSSWLDVTGSVLMAQHNPCSFVDAENWWSKHRQPREQPAGTVDWHLKSDDHLLSSWPAHPKWTPTWSMARSTIMMPCNITGYFDPALASTYGIVDVDWSNAKSLWERARPMDNSARLIEQAAQIKAADRRTRVMVYRNLVHVGAWFREVQEKLSDAKYSGWFLKFRKGETQVERCPVTTK